MKERVAETVDGYEVAAWAEGRINELMGVINAATAELVSVTAKVLEEEGRPVAWSRKRRTIDPVLRSLLEERDQVCGAPWCQQSRWLEWHHLRHHEDGGETTPENLKGFCGRDHLMHHLGLFDVHGNAARPDGLVFTDKFGRQIKARPEPIPPEFGPVETARALGIDVGSWLPPTGESFDPHWFDWQQ